MKKFITNVFESELAYTREIFSRTKSCWNDVPVYWKRKRLC